MLHSPVKYCSVGYFRCQKRCSLVRKGEGPVVDGQRAPEPESLAEVDLDETSKLKSKLEFPSGILSKHRTYTFELNKLSCQSGSVAHSNGNIQLLFLSKRKESCTWSENTNKINGLSQTLPRYYLLKKLTLILRMTVRKRLDFSLPRNWSIRS